MARLIMKSRFKNADKVYYDDFKKEGIVTITTLNKLTIYTGKGTVFRHPQVVYKKSETLGCGHWDSLSKEDRITILNKHKVSIDLSKRDWHHIPGGIKQIIYKAEGSGVLSPTGINTDVQNVYNPVTSDKTVTDRIKEELEEQSKDDDKPKEEKKDKKKNIKKNNKKKLRF